MFDVKINNFINYTLNKTDWFGLVWFYGISTIEDYLILNPVYSYIFDIWFVNISQQIWIVSSIAIYHLQFN